MKNRKNEMISFLYVIGIVFVVAGHCSGGGISVLFEWMPVYTFHLALFTFCSGYLFKKEYVNHIYTYIFKKFKRLIVPMYIYSFIYLLFITLIKKYGFDFGAKEFSLYNFFVLPWVNGHQFVFTTGLWYVTSLFLIQVFNVIYCKIFKNKSIIIFILYMVFGIIGVILANKGYNKGFYLTITRVLYLLPFFGFGILYRDHLEKRIKVKNITFFSIWFIVLLSVITYNKGIISFTPSWMNDFPNPLIVYVLGFCGLLFWLRIAKIVSPYIKNNKIIEFISSNTYEIMVHQFFAFFVLNTFYAIISKIFTLNFEWIKYKTDIYYRYLPFNIPNYKFLYLLMGIFVPILISYLIKNIKIKCVKNA